jgi:hypothetical protein
MTDTKSNPELPSRPLKKRIGLLTIGQSPRDDLMSELKPLLSPDIVPVEYGILDDLSPEQISLSSPGPSEFPLVSRISLHLDSYHISRHRGETCIILDR